MSLYEKICDMYEAYIRKYYEHKFNINTSGSIQLENRHGHANYAPSPYHYLAYYFKSHPFSKNSYYVDFGCGLGRTVFLASHFGCEKSIGVDVNEDMYKAALKNLSSYLIKMGNNHAINFYLCPAEIFNIEKDMNYFYFFNPFYLKFFIKVTNNILNSYKDYPRQIKLLMYCPAEEYERYLLKHSSFEMCEEILFKDGAFIHVYTIKKI